MEHWIYSQREGRFQDIMGVLMPYVCYSGFGTGKNNPEMESVHNVGPLPTGYYVISAPYDTTDLGPYVLPLIADPENVMYGRSGFFCHGDSISHPGQASHGCIIAPRQLRTLLWLSACHLLQVVKEF